MMAMRRTLPVLLSVLFAIPGVARAQPPAGAQAQGAAAPTPSNDESAGTNLVDVIARGTTFSAGSDEGRFQRYRDLRNGGTLDAFRFAREDGSRSWSVVADHVGYRDQRYSAAYERFGKLRVTFDWNQIPLFFTDQAATLFTDAGGGMLLMNDAVQAGLQNKTLTLPAAATQAVPFELREQRNVMDLRLRYTALPNVDWNMGIRNTTKTGHQPWAGSFGFSDAVELAVPLDTRTTELGTSLEWTGDRGLARVGYDGSFFRNNVSTLVWDNPLRITDSPTLGPVQGRMALWPNSNMNTVSATGLLKLPRRSQATAYLSVGNWTQNDPLIPFTINSALAAPALDRSTADAKAVVTAANLSFTSRPVDRLWLTARFRSYDFDNRTPVFNVPTTVSYDTTVAPFADGGTSPYEFTRRTVDVEGAYTPAPFTSVRLGYTHEQVDQTFRAFDKTREDTARVSADTTRLSWLTLRAVYEHGRRVGSGFDEQALDDIGEQVSLRQFDISDRTSNRFSGIAIVTPLPALSINGSLSAGNEDRPGTVFGLRSNTNRGYGVGVDFVPSKAVSAGLSYELEKFATTQASRQANPGPQFDDPTRDWTTDADDRARTVAASVDLLKLLPKTDVRVAYDYSHAESTYVYGLAPNSTLPPVMQLPTVTNTFHRATADVRYSVTRHFTAGASYWYDQYRVDDFAMGAETVTSIAQPSYLMIGYLVRPYTASTFIGRITYVW